MPDQTTPESEAARLVWVSAEIAEIKQRAKVVDMEREMTLNPSPAQVRLQKEQIELHRLERIRVSARESMSRFL